MKGRLPCWVSTAVVSFVWTLLAGTGAQTDEFVFFFRTELTSTYYRDGEKIFLGAFSRRVCPPVVFTLSGA